MLDTITPPRPPEWGEFLGEFGLSEASSILIAGEDATAMAAAFQDAGSPPIAYDRDDFALLAAEAELERLDEATALDTGFADGSVDVVVLRHAWSQPIGVGAAVKEAARVLRADGALVAAEFDLGRLLRTTATEYPSQLLYARYPDVTTTVRASLAPPAALAVASVRFGFGSVVSMDIDETRGVFAEYSAYLEFLREYGWRGWEYLPADAADPLLEDVDRMLPHIAPLGPIVDQEPWRYVKAVKSA